MTIVFLDGRGTAGARERDTSDSEYLVTCDGTYKNTASDPETRMTTIEYEGTVLSIGETTVELRHPVREVCQVDDVVLVVLDVLEVPYETDDIDNVLGFSTDGDRLWEIDNPVSDGSLLDAYQGFRMKDGEVWVLSCADAKHRLDVDTGEIVKKGQTW